MNSVIDWNALNFQASFSRRDAGDDLRPVAQHLFGMKAALVACYPLNDDSSVPIY